MRPSTKAELLACVRDLHHKWKRSRGVWHVRFHVSVCLKVCMYSACVISPGVSPWVYENLLELRSTWGWLCGCQRVCVSPWMPKMFHSSYDAAVVLRVCCTIPQTLKHICPDTALQPSSQWCADSSNATVLEQICFRNREPTLVKGTQSLLSTCPKAAEQMPWCWWAFDLKLMCKGQMLMHRFTDAATQHTRR
jgi:hypothetical protein